MFSYDSYFATRKGQSMACSYYLAAMQRRCQGMVQSRMSRWMPIVLAMLHLLPTERGTRSIYPIDVYILNDSIASRSSAAAHVVSSVIFPSNYSARA